MKNKNYITIQGWMVNELKLSGNELILYALIYGFSQDGESKFKGTMQYLADSLGISKRSALSILKMLVKKNYIKKYETGKSGNKKCDYDVNSEILKKICGQDTLPPSGEETSPEAVKKLHRSGEETSHHIYINKDIDINNNISSTAFAVEQKEIVPISIPDKNKIVPVSKPPPKKKHGIELTEDQKPLFHAAKACFETDEKTKALMYQDRGSAQMYMENLKLFVVRCQNMAPGITADFMRTVLDHFRTMTGGKLKGKAEFTPRSLIVPWVWESVIGSLPDSDNEYTERVRASVKGMFK